jgi:hypothetical protein
MQVKCIKKDLTLAPAWFPDACEHEVKHSGSSTLHACRDQGGEGIQLTASFFRGNNKGADSFWRSKGLMILGGRRSITQWLRLQGEGPMMYNNVGEGHLFAYIVRKKRALGKDLTMVCITAFAGLAPQGGGWTLTCAMDLRDTPEAPRPQGIPLGEMSPRNLADVLDRAFAIMKN